MTRYFLFAGEASGDLHGSHLIQALHHQDKSADFYGVGGPKMRQEKLTCILPTEQFQVMGFSDVIKAFPRLYQLFYQVRDQILALQPDCVILIDYPAFNLRLARSLRKQGFKGKLVQYICPTIWAHGRHRMKILIDHYDLLLTIFPFEAAYFEKTPLRVEYIGHVLVEMIQSHLYQLEWYSQIGLLNPHNLIALFPGSRQGEIIRHLPQQLKAAEQLKQHDPQLRFVVSCAQEEFKQQIEDLIQQSVLCLNQDVYIIPSEYRYELMRDCCFALAKSGTLTLELALHQVPTIVHYELSLLNKIIAKYILRIHLPYYCVANILGKQEIFPEYVDHRITPSILSQHLIDLKNNSEQQVRMIEACRNLKQQLSSESCMQTATNAIQDLLKC